MSDSLQLPGLQHTRLSCPSLSPGVCSNSCSLNLHQSNHLILCCPLFFLPSIFPSIRVFSKELALHLRWPKYWSFHFSISPSIEYSGLISFRTDWCETNIIKLLEENIGRTLSDTDCSNIFFKPSPRIMEIETKINKWDLFKFKGFCTAKETTTKTRKDNLQIGRK